jgi:Ca2+-transporting ATPase
MARKPKDPQEALITKSHWLHIMLYGLIMAVCVTGSYVITLKFWQLGAQKANNVAFFALALAQFWHVFNMRENDENFWLNQVTKNKYIWLALLVSISGLAAAYFVPVLKRVLALQMLSLRAWFLIFVTSLAPLLIIQTYKLLRHLLNRKTG